MFARTLFVMASLGACVRGGVRASVQSLARLIARSPTQGHSWTPARLAHNCHPTTSIFPLFAQSQLPSLIGIKSLRNGVTFRTLATANPSTNTPHDTIESVRAANEAPVLVATSSAKSIAVADSVSGDVKPTDGAVVDAPETAAAEDDAISALVAEGLEALPRHCRGCGAQLQTDNPTQRGFIRAKALSPAPRDPSVRPPWDRHSVATDLPLSDADIALAAAQGQPIELIPSWGDVQAQMKSARERPIICQRCHDLRFRNKGSSTELTEDEFEKYIAVIRRRKCLIVNVVDLCDFPLSSFSALDRVVGSEGRVLFVGTKADLFVPRIDRHLDVVREWFKSAVLASGSIPNSLKERIAGFEVVSSRTQDGLKRVATAIERHRNGPELYAIGYANAGKSSLLNGLLSELGYRRGVAKKAPPLTVSPIPGTTLASIPIPLPRHRDRPDVRPFILHDTPGILRQSSILSGLTSEEITDVVPRDRKFDRRSFRLTDGKTLFIGGLARIDVAGLGEHGEAFLCVAAASTVSTHVCKTENADWVFDKHAGSGILTPPHRTPASENPPPSLDAASTFEVVGKGTHAEAVEVVISGLGTVSFRAKFGAKATLFVRLPTGVAVVLREPIPITEKGAVKKESGGTIGGNGSRKNKGADEPNVPSVPAARTPGSMQRSVRPHRPLPDTGDVRRSFIKRDSDGGREFGSGGHHKLAGAGTGTDSLFRRGERGRTRSAAGRAGRDPTR